MRKTLTALGLMFACSLGAAEVPAAALAAPEQTPNASAAARPRPTCNVVKHRDGLGGGVDYNCAGTDSGRYYAWVRCHRSKGRHQLYNTRWGNITGVPGRTSANCQPRERVVAWGYRSVVE
jgi:hypothetical protein